MKSVSSNVTIRLVQAIGEWKELRVPMTLISKTHLKTVETTTVVDSRAAGTFISEDSIKLHKIQTHCLSKPFKVTTTNGSLSKSGPITHYCVLTVKIDDCAMIGKFNVTYLGWWDQILLGIPWLHTMDPLIHWRAGRLTLPHTPKSDLIEEDVNIECKKNGLPPLFTKIPKYTHSKLQKESVKPECIDSTIPVSTRLVKPEHIYSMIPLTASIEEVPDEERSIPVSIPNKTLQVFDTKEDIWENFEPPVYDVSAYLLWDDDVLIEYQADGSEMCIIENVSFDTPLTQDGTSKAEQKLNLPQPKFSNKVQQFAMAGGHREAVWCTNLAR
jgi:hypothetical protein